MARRSFAVPGGVQNISCNTTGFWRCLTIGRSRMDALSKAQSVKLRTIEGLFRFTPIAADLALPAWLTSSESACSPLVGTGSTDFILLRILICSSLPGMEHSVLGERFLRRRRGGQVDCGP